MKTFVKLIAALILSFGPALELKADAPARRVEEEVVVSANRYPTPQSRIGSSVTTLDEEDFERVGDSQVNEVLTEVPGVDIVTTGVKGGNSAVFIRGANSEHTLVLLDGIELNSPINPTRAFNFSSLNLSGIEKIEVLRGPQSTLYGSDAMGGVINIITKRGAGEPAAGALLEAGSFDTYLQQANLGGAGGGFDYSLSASRETTGGISSADRALGNTEADGFLNTTLTGNFGWLANSGSEIRTVLRYADSRAERDITGGPGGDDPNTTIFSQDFFSRLEGKFRGLGDKLTQTVGGSYALQNFQDDNYPDDARPLDKLKSKYFGKLLKFDWRADYVQSDRLTVVGGIETKEERGASDLFSDSIFGPFESEFGQETARTHSAYVHAIISPAANFDAALGARIDDNEDFGSEGTYRFAPVYRIGSTATRLHASIGTGFKAPSLFELFSEFGSPDLDAESSWGYDAGIEQSFCGNRGSVDLTFFWNEFDDLITFDPATFLFENIASAHSDGLEVSLRFDPNEIVSFGADMTYTNTRDDDTDLSLLRRARVKVGGHISFRPAPDWTASIRGSYIGRRPDNNFETFPPSIEVLGGYSVFDARLGYQVTDRIELFARVENIFDRKYQEVLGFGAEPATYFAGLNFEL